MCVATRFLIGPVSSNLIEIVWNCWWGNRFWLSPSLQIQKCSKKNWSITAKYFWDVSLVISSVCGKIGKQRFIGNKGERTVRRQWKKLRTSVRKLSMSLALHPKRAVAIRVAKIATLRMPKKNILACIWWRTIYVSANNTVECLRRPSQWPQWGRKFGISIKKCQAGKQRKVTKPIVCNRSDEDGEDEPCSYPHVRDHGFGERIGWTIDRVNRSIIMRHFDNSPGIYTCATYASACLTYFLYHVADVDLDSVSNKCYGVSKVWYVIYPSSSGFREGICSWSIFSRPFERSWRRC